MLKKLFALYLLATIAFVPAYAFAHGGIDDGDEEETTTTGQVAVSPAHAEGFTLATPFSGKWWILLGVSLILMGFLSMAVKGYLDADYPEGKDPMRYWPIIFIAMGILLTILILYGSGHLKNIFP